MGCFQFIDTTRAVAGRLIPVFKIGRTVKPSSMLSADIGPLEYFLIGNPALIALFIFQPRAGYMGDAPKQRIGSDGQIVW